MKFMKSSLALMAGLVVTMCAPAFADAQIEPVKFVQLDVGQSVEPMVVRSIEPVAFYSAFELEPNAIDAINLASDIPSPNSAMPDRNARSRIQPQVRPTVAKCQMHQHSTLCSEGKTEVGWS